ncbi:MAG TPA: LysM peptidoglycan-binding domain-containing protein [Thermoguttaceae bacterium]
MNSLKTLMVMGVLAAVVYGMYVSLWEKPQQSALDDAPPFTGPPTVQIPGLNSAAPQSPGLISSTQVNPAADFSNSSTTGFPANQSTVTATGGSTVDGVAAAVAPPTSSGSLTLLSPPGSTNATSISQTDAPADAMPGFINNTTTNQAPAATYPSSPSAVTPLPLAPPVATSPVTPSPIATSTAAQPASGSLPATLSSDSAFQSKFAAFMDAVQKKLDEGKLSEAQLALSSLYDNPDLPQAQARQVTELLDQLAGTVIYSRKHYLEQPYIVQPGDTLDQIAEKYNVPALLLVRINGISDPQRLEPGRELKVMRGPFDAVIHLDKHNLSLMVQGRYAGRFSIGVGCDQPRLEGTYTVREKNINPSYHGPDGTMVPGGDPRNPLGKFWIGLSDNVGLHGTVDTQNIGRDDNRGTICLTDRDIDDLYGILSVGSRVVIQR